MGWAKSDPRFDLFFARRCFFAETILPFLLIRRSLRVSPCLVPWAVLFQTSRLDPCLFIYERQ
jgi:hypothetical protein